MPAHALEVSEAKEEGVKMRWLRTVQRVLPGQIVVERMVLGEDGRPRPTGELETLDADTVVLAIGQDVDLTVVRDVPGVRIEDGVVRVDEGMMTGHPSLFAGGDMVEGDRTITVAVGQGARAARGIDAYLRGATPVERARCRSRPSRRSTPGTTARAAPPWSRPSPPSGDARRSTRCVGGWTRRTRSSRRAGAFRADTASSATTATACAPTTPSSSAAPVAGSASTSTIARGAASARTSAPAARSRWSPRTGEGDDGHSYPTDATLGPFRRARERLR